MLEKVYPGFSERTYREIHTKSKGDIRKGLELLSKEHGTPRR